MLFAGNNDEVDWNVQFSKGNKQNFKKTITYKKLSIRLYFPSLLYTLHPSHATFHVPSVGRTRWNEILCTSFRMVHKSNSWTPKYTWYFNVKIFKQPNVQVTYFQKRSSISVLLGRFYWSEFPFHTLTLNILER